MSVPTPSIVERILGGEGRRELPNPARPTYRLSEMLPRRPRGPAYTLPGEMGAPLARAFERAMDLIERGHGGLLVHGPARFLTPRWHRVLLRLSHHGLARTIQWSWPLLRGIPLYYFDIGSPFFEHETDGARPELSRYSRGFAESYDLALSKVVGECLERAPLARFRMKDFMRGSPRSLREARVSFVSPSDLSVFSAEQIARRPEMAHDDDSVFHWTEATSLTTSKKAWIPAQVIHWNYPVAWGDMREPMLRECSAHGAGGFFSVEGAILSGLLECIQRDAFFLHWLRGRIPDRVDTGTILRADTRALVESAREVGLEPLFLDITSDLGIPTCLCILRRSDDELPHACMGGSTRVDAEDAIHGALLEAASVHHLMAMETTRLRLPDDYEPFTDPTFDTHKRLAFWANPDHARHLDFFVAGKTISAEMFGRQSVLDRSGVETSEAHALDAVTQVLRERGVEAWYVEASHPALDELGYASVRVVAPSLVPLYYEERNAPLGVARLYSSPLVQSLPKLPLTPWPHPFP